MPTITREIVYVRRLLANFGVFLTISTPFTCENQSVAKIATNLVFMRERSTLKSTATSLVSISLQTLYHFHIFAQRSRLQTSLQSHILQRTLEPCWQTHDV